MGPLHKTTSFFLCWYCLQLNGVLHSWQGAQEQQANIKEVYVTAKVLRFIPRGESWSIPDLAPISPGRRSVFFINLFIYFWAQRVLVAAHGLSHCGAQTLCLWLTVSTAGGFNSFRPPAQLSHAMWDLIPRPGIEPVSPAWKTDS